VQDASDAETAAAYALRDLEAGTRRAEEGRARTVKLRGQIEERRGRIERLQSSVAAPTEGEVEALLQQRADAQAWKQAADDRVHVLEGKLAAAKQAAADAQTVLDSIERQRQAMSDRQTKADDAVQTIANLQGEIADLEDVLRNAAPPAPSEEQIAEARDRVEQARVSVHAATIAANLDAIRKDHARANAVVEEARDKARDLDKLVKRWQHDVPREVFATHGGIPGLTIDDDVRLDGIAIGHLSGKERLALCVALARRLNAKSRFIVQDGLEAIDEDELRAFLAAATADGYQLLATRVTRGDLTIIPVDEVLAAEPTTAAALRGGAA
jgi:DNA repair exonuclease SbcCD ATPase subunit